MLTGTRQCERVPNTGASSLRGLVLVLVVFLVAACQETEPSTSAVSGAETVATGDLGDAVLAMYQKRVLPDKPSWAGQVELLDGSFNDTFLAIETELLASRQNESVATDICEGFIRTAGHGDVPNKLSIAVISADAEKMADCTSSAPEPSESQNNGSEGPLPFDGGSYTWVNGVTMTVSVERVEAWGDKDDYCGDGSCGISNPDDLRWVLKYEVSVPETMNKPFDPSRCPGELQILNGNDDESIIGVSGDYARFLDGNIFPGATKFGVEEYSIEKDALGGEFYIESGCGDPNYSGDETAIFGGIIDFER